ncbi:MAG: hypothetical protein ACXV7D_14175, partial [Thermoanaerobaculia bacterium]
MNRFVRAAVWTLVLAGAALRIWQYAGGESLYVDELSIAGNLAGRTLISLLTEPLTGSQVAPPGFLLLEKLAVDVFGATDLAMRLVPLLAGLATLVLFARLVLRVDESVSAVLAMALFATAMPLIYYSAQLKQYSLDVLASVLMLSSAMDLWPVEVTRRARIMAALNGALIVWFSHASVLVLCGLGAVLLVRTIRVRWKQIAPVVLVWAVASVAATAWALFNMTPGTRAYMRVFWVEGFMPLPLRTAIATRWPLLPLVQFFGTVQAVTLRYPFPALFVLLVVVGFIALWRIRRDACALSLAPIVVALAAAAAHQYPFHDRLIMFLIPNFLLALAAIPRWIASRPLAWAFALLIGAAGISPIIRTPPVYRMEDIKPVLRALREQRSGSDPIYIYYGAAAAAARYAGEAGLRADDFDFGDCHRADTRSYFRELDRYRGGRVWIVMQHATPAYCERDDILGYLNAIGTERQGIVVPSTITSFPIGASAAYLYDLRDLQRLRAASADTFPLRGRQTLDAAFP